MATTQTIQREGGRSANQAAKSLDKNASKGFDQLASGLSTAIQNVEEIVDPANFKALTDFLKPVGEFSRKAWNTTVRYSKEHPYRVGITVLALGIAGYRLAQAKRV